MVWLRRAAAQGETVAQGDIGYLYEHGLGVAQDDAQAVQWYRQAAHAGYAKAQFLLGNLLDQGRGVRRPDHVAAERLIKRAAAQGDEEALAWQAQPHINGVRVSDYLQFHLSLRAQLGLALVIILLASVLYRTLRHKPLWPRKPRNALFF